MKNALHPPIEVIASWTPNYDDPVTRGPGILVMVAIFQVACYTTVVLRVWARLVPKFTFEWDDILIIFNLLPLTGAAVCTWLGYTKYGFDRHVEDVPLGTLVGARKIVFAVYNLYLWATGLTKVSILLFNRRLTRGSLSPTFTRMIYVTIASVVAYTVSITLVTFAGCRPLNSFWNQVDFVWTAQHKYHCVNEPAVLVSAAVISMVQDFMCFLMPLVVFWKLNITFRQKVALTLLFSFGFILCLCGLLRAYYTTRLYFHTWDMTWDGHSVWILTMIEMHMALICASGPALNHWFRNVLGMTWLGSKILSSINRTKTVSSNPTSQPTVESSQHSYVMRNRAPHSSFVDARDTKDFRVERYSSLSGDEENLGPRAVKQSWLEDDSASASNSERRFRFGHD